MKECLSNDHPNGCVPYNALFFSMCPLKKLLQSGVAFEKLLLLEKPTLSAKIPN